MDAQIFQLDEQRLQRRAPIAFPVHVDLIEVTRSAMTFYAWYAGAMVSVHVALVQSAIESVQDTFSIEGKHHE